MSHKHPLMLAAVVLLVGMSAACGDKSSSTMLPASPTPAPPTQAQGFGAVNPTGLASVDFARCLARSASNCFTSSSVTARAVGASATTAPGAPGNFSASASDSTVTLRWSAPASGDAPTSYIIEAGSSPGLANLANFSTLNTNTTFSASNVGAGTYYVRVRATNLGFASGGTSDPSNEAVLTVGSVTCVAPGAPSNLAVTANAGGVVTFVWTGASGNPTSYIIEAGSAAGLSNIANGNLGSTATNYTATGVGSGTYYVRLRATNSCGTSGPSNELVLTAGGATPPGSRIIGLSGNLAFGDVPVGSSATRTFTISNSGNSPLTWNAGNTGSIAIGFTGSSSGTLAAGGSVTVTLIFRPPASGNYSGTMTVVSDATGGTNAIAYSATSTGVATRIIALSGDLAFGTVTTGSSVSRTLTISNSGNSLLTWNGLVITAGPSTGFTANPTSGTVAPGGSATVTVTYAPSIAGFSSSQLWMFSDATSGSTDAVNRISSTQVSGTAVAR